MLKVHLSLYPILNQDMLKANGCVLVEDPTQADFVIYFSTEQYEDQVDRSSAMMIQVEPPLSSYRRMAYSRDFLDTFHSVFTFNPDVAAKNQFPITKNPMVFPYYPRSSLRVTRDYSDIQKARKFYYAGDRYQQIDSPSEHGNVNLYTVRKGLVEYLAQKTTLNNYITGPGWDNGNDTRYCDDWRAEKLLEIERENCDFVLCLENSRYPNYISEKIHDGFNSDRVVLYLGEPSIDCRIPDNAFINLGVPPFYKPLNSPAKCFINYNLVGDLLLNMTQSDYNSIINAARKFRDTFLTEEAYRKQQDILTEAVLKRMFRD